MQINDGNLLGANRAATPQADRTGLTTAASGAAAGKRSVPGDAVELSSFANSINGLQEDSSVREAHVEELRALYRSGSYEVDPAVLAESIVRQHIRG